MRYMPVARSRGLTDSDAGFVFELVRKAYFEELPTVIDFDFHKPPGTEYY